ncbi:hypothetical protein CSUI_007985, partial [Cystoisospora suis]
MTWRRFCGAALCRESTSSCLHAKPSLLVLRESLRFVNSRCVNIPYTVHHSLNPCRQFLVLSAFGVQGLYTRTRLRVCVQRKGLDSFPGVNMRLSLRQGCGV